MRAAFLFSCAFPSIAIATSALTEEICQTELGPSSVQHVPSVTETINIPLTAYQKVCETIVSTITPPPTTSTVTSTATTTDVISVPQTTDTVTQTNTATITNTETDTSTFTSTSVTSTQVTSTPTSVVPTPPGFTSVSQEAGYSPKNKRSAPGRLAPRGKSLVLQQKKLSDGKALFFPPAYPTSVNCVEFIKSITTSTITDSKCACTDTTTLPVSTITTTTTTTLTTTSTSCTPDATSTITASTTITQSLTTETVITATVTSTSTTTSIAPTTTTYAACGPANIVSSANGGERIEQVTFNSANSANQVIADSTARTPYDCCVACQQKANCIFSDFISGGCDLVIATTCDATSTHNTGFFTEAGEGDSFTVSNGPCGQIPDDGPIM